MGSTSHVDHDHPPLLHVAQRFAKRAARAPTRPKSVTVRRERRVDSRLHHLQHRLLNETIQDGRDPELPTTALRLGDRYAPHRRRNITPIEQRLPNTRPVLSKPTRQLICRHPVDPGSTFVSPNSLQRGEQIGPLNHELHLHVRSQICPSIRRRRRFLAGRRKRGFTSPTHAEPRLREHLRQFVVETHGDLILLLVRSFDAVHSATQGPRRLLRPLLTSRSATPRRPFRRKARSPEVRTTHFAARSPDLRLRPLVAGTSRSLGRSSRSSGASYPVLVHRPAASLHASFTPASRSDALRFASIGLRPPLGGTPTPCVSPMFGAPEVPALRARTHPSNPLMAPLPLRSRGSVSAPEGCRQFFSFDGG